MGLSLRTWVASILLLTHLVHGALGWGVDGHYAVCKIAQSYFEEKTLVAVKKILPVYANGELAAVCSWPDEIKRRPEWSCTYALHFVNTPDNECNYEYSRGTHNDKCVTGAIFNYTSQLMFQFHYNLTEALMFVSHFMGDIHQPLHEGFVGDQGGNKIKLNWYEQETNLHRVWDNKIIESAQEKYYNSSLSVMIHSLQHKLKYAWSNDVPSWESCPPHKSACPNPYASESIDLACKYAYKNAAPGTTLGVFISGEFSHLCKRVMIAEAETKDMMEEIQSQKKEEDEDEEEGPPPGWESTVLPPPPSPPISAVTTATAAEISEMAQMVCGSCRRLLSYPRGTKHVKCSCCQTVNLVLEAYQVGQVKCSNCELLLMYPYGAPSVRCSSCKSVTDIREDNKRPPWSVLQGPLKTFSSVR
ncbi:unnamed protein product [Brassica oleracea]